MAKKVVPQRPVMSHAERAERRYQMARMLNSGRPLHEVAQHFGVSIWAAKAAREEFPAAGTEDDKR